MAILKCKMCGGDLEIEGGSTVAECAYCGTRQTVPSADNEKKLTLFARANRLRFACEYDKAAGVYESIVADYPEEAEAYWGLILCKYGIEYVTDPATEKKIPTCHRSSFESVMDDDNFELVMENADALSTALYREEAKKIEELRKRIIEVSSKEEAYDIFICYKETDTDGNRTLDSVIAQDVYDALTHRGYRVFFSRITLEDKLGQEYEPYIFAALNSSKIMLAFGTSYEHYNAVWVKNEWSRFLQLMAAGQKKTLIPCYKNIDAYDMPKEFAKLQAQDMGKVGAEQDLLRGIEKILPKQSATPAVKETVVVSSGASVTVDSLSKRVSLYLEDGNWKQADEYCEKLLDINPEYAPAYLGKLMAKLQVRKREDLARLSRPFDGEDLYRKTLRYADLPLKNELDGYLRAFKARNAEALRNKTYQDACALMNDLDDLEALEHAAEMFSQIAGHRDADALLKKVKDKIRDIHEEMYICAVNDMEAGDYMEAHDVFLQLAAYKDSAQKAEACLEALYNQAISIAQIKALNDQNKAKALFLSIADYRDSKERAAACDATIDALNREAEEAGKKRIEEEIRQRDLARVKNKKLVNIFSLFSVVLLLASLFAVSYCWENILYTSNTEGESMAPYVWMLYGILVLTGFLSMPLTWMRREGCAPVVLLALYILASNLVCLIRFTTHYPEVAAGDNVIGGLLIIAGGLLFAAGGFFIGMVLVNAKWNRP